MSNHLPECIYKPEKIDWARDIVERGNPCVCVQLHACEKRVLDAARKTVERRKTTCDMECCHVGNAVLDGALAAIDALKEKP